MSIDAVTATRAYGLAVHAGAGSLDRTLLTARVESNIRTALEAAREAGFRLLERGASSIDAVEAAITVLEDCELFNAGVGSVYTATGGHELEAALMSGRHLAAGGAVRISTVKNPIRLARRIMERGHEVLLVGDAAEAVAREFDLEEVANSYFDTPGRLAEHQGALGAAAIDREWEGNSLLPMTEYGTVGAVAADQQGDVCAGTSTGGLVNKTDGRIGDSAVLGAGTYADNNGCGISATGQGEIILRLSLAKGINDRVIMRGSSLSLAVHEAVHNELSRYGGSGGVIAITSNSEVVCEFNTKAMFRACRTSRGEVGVAIFGAGFKDGDP
ncbi:isoaspartyl peptidase/L-asparaginase family protein [Thiohalocapsa sp. ML1]|jgi:L-asparaginase / beta-aspartyl-peptidase|uniref:isoaspartyl peptidase/L-asparaginase family protein n=1 Tax=Thiohalocapsa sp. ML1 TaxID=1431688 RepID=UPI00138F3BF9|nr:isoaspartyl peptidase/L-asparaginase [Thiohalocapsa sp. ML1]